MAGDQPVLVGILWYLLVAAGPLVVLWLSARAVPGGTDALRRWWASRSGPMASGPTLEALVADTRRLRRELTGVAPRTRVRQLALLCAYDDALGQLCGVLGIATALPARHAAPPVAATTVERAVIRLLAEGEVERAGITLDPPGSCSSCPAGSE